MSEEGPSEVFRAYLSAVAIDGQGARVAERWAGIEAWRRKATAGEIPPLVANVWGELGAETDALKPLIDEIVSVDDSFNTIVAPEALRVLSAAALDNAFTYSNDIDLPACLAVLTGSWGQRDPANLAVDILERAAAEFDHIADSRRARTDLSNDIAEIAAPVLPISTAPLKLLKENGQNDGPTIAAALEEIAKSANKSLSSQNAALKKQLTEMSERVALCDEEVDLLWYVFANVSADGKLPFAQLDPRKAAFYCAREITEITSVPLRTDVARELFRRCSADGDAAPLAKSVEVMDPDWIREHVPGNLSPRLFPIHKALDRFADIGEPNTWVSSWSKATGIPPDFAVDPNNLALEFYRERLLVKELA